MANDQSDKTDEITAMQWRQLRLALADRLAHLVERRNDSADPAEVAQLQKQIDEVRQQVRTLAVEENVAQFVEDAERYVITANTLADDLSRDPDEEVA